jgi:hypothetical protein
VQDHHDTPPSAPHSSLSTSVISNLAVLGAFPPHRRRGSTNPLAVHGRPASIQIGLSFARRPSQVSISTSKPSGTLVYPIVTFRRVAATETSARFS